MKKKILCLALAAMCLLSACGQNSKEVVATVGENEITMNEFNFYLEGIKQQMQGTELTTEEDWQTKDIGGKKAIDIAKEKALDNAAHNIAFIEIYKKLGNTIGDAEKEEIKKTKDSIVSQYEKNGGYEKFLKDANITDEFVDMMCESIFCSDKLARDFMNENKDVPQEEIDAFYEEHYDEYFFGYRRAKHVLILTQDEETKEPFPEEKKAEAKKKADGIFKRAKDGENFDKLVEQYSEDPGSKTNPDGYTFGDGEMVKEFQDCVDSLKPGEIGFVESPFGYHIIQRLEVDKNYFTDEIRRRIVGGKFNDYIDGKMEEYGLVVEEKEAINKALKKK